MLRPPRTSVNRRAAGRRRPHSRNILHGERMDRRTLKQYNGALILYARSLEPE